MAQFEVFAVKVEALHWYYKGEDVFRSCEVSHLPDSATLDWERDRGPTANTTLIYNNTAHIIIHSADPYSEGTYNCSLRCNGALVFSIPRELRIYKGAYRTKHTLYRGSLNSSEVVLICSILRSRRSASWKWEPLSRTNVIIVASADKYKNASMSIEVDKERFSSDVFDGSNFPLRISPVKFGDSGRYSCSFDAYRDPEVTITLVTVQEPVPPLCAARVVSEQQEWSSTGQDTESTLTAVKLEFTEPQRHRQEEEEHRGLESGTDGSVIPSPRSKRECDPDCLNQPTFPPRCGKRDSVQDSQKHPDLRLKIGNTEEEEEEESVLGVTHYQIKTETDGGDCIISEEPAEGLFLHKINTASETDQSENSGRVNEDTSSRPLLPSSEQRSKEHPDLLQGDGSLSCVYCGQVFFLLSRLKSHLRTHTEDNSSYQCNVCGKCFSQSGNLNVHQRVHTGKKPYCCNICGKSFNYSGKFKEHQRIHTGERPYRCGFCGKYFSQSGHLKAHERIHTGEKPYRCPVCGTCFSQLSQIKRHLLTHSLEMSLGSHTLGAE